MNVSRKMILIPENVVESRSHIGNVLNKQAEHQIRSKKESHGVFSQLNNLLESQVPSALKMRLFNSLISTYLDKKDEKVSDSSFREKKQNTAESKIVDLQSKQEEKNNENNAIAGARKSTKRKSSTERCKKRLKLIQTKFIADPQKRIRKPNKRYINEQFGTGIIVPIKWTTLKKF